MKACPLSKRGVIFIFSGCGCVFVDPKQKCKPLDTSLGEDGFRVKGGKEVRVVGSIPYQVRFY